MRKILLATVVLAMAMSAAQAVEYAVYDGKISESFLSTSVKDPSSHIIAKGSKSIILIVNRGTDNAVMVVYDEKAASVETNTVAIANYAQSTKNNGKVIASKDIVSMLIDDNAVLLGTFSSVTKGEKTKLSENYKGGEIDGTATEESVGNVAIKYNAKVSADVATLLDAYVAKKTKNKVTAISLP